jgi:hypothetical protein
MPHISRSTEAELTDALAYAGLILLAFELIKSLVVGPIKTFYADTTFGQGMPFVSYEHDDSDDVQAIQDLRKHRNDLAHDLPSRLADLKIEDHARLLRASDKALFKLSNHQTYIEIGSDPKFKNLGIDWETAKGHEYLLFEEVLNRIRRLKSRLQ